MPSLTGRTSVFPISIFPRKRAVTAARSLAYMMANDLWEGWCAHCPNTFTSSLPSIHFWNSFTSSDPTPPSLPGHVIWSCSAVTWKSMAVPFLVWIVTKLTSAVYMIDFGPRRILYAYISQVGSTGISRVCRQGFVSTWIAPWFVHGVLLRSLVVLGDLLWLVGLS